MKTLMENETLQNVVPRLSDLKATYEYPGFVSISVEDKLYFAFGTANYAFGYDVITTGEKSRDDKYFDNPNDTLPFSATVDQLEDFIRKTVSEHSQQFKPQQY